MTQVRKMKSEIHIKLNLNLVVKIIKEEFVFPVYVFSIPPCFNYCDMRLQTPEPWSRVSRVILIFASPGGGGAGHGVPIYFRILQHFDIITSSFLGNSLAKSELNSNCLHRHTRSRRKDGMELKCKVLIQNLKFTNTRAQ